MKIRQFILKAKVSNAFKMSIYSTKVEAVKLLIKIDFFVMLAAEVVLGWRAETAGKFRY